MAYNSTTQLIGNLGQDPEIIDGPNKKFAVLRLATQDSYPDPTEKDENGKPVWHNKATVWHQIYVFGAKAIENVSAFKSGDRISVTGSLSYKPHEITNDEGKTYKIMEANIVAGKIEPAPLPAKEAHPVPEPS